MQKKKILYNAGEKDSQPLPPYCWSSQHSSRLDGWRRDVKELEWTGDEVMRWGKQGMPYQTKNFPVLILHLLFARNTSDEILHGTALEHTVQVVGIAERRIASMRCPAVGSDLPENPTNGRTEWRRRVKGQ